MEICHKHGIAFDALKCPSCELEERIEDLEDELDNLKWQIHSIISEKKEIQTIDKI